jgi:hypothetical protein
MLQPMDTFTTTPAARSHLERLLTASSALLFDRASLDGVECLDSGWDEWDACVAEQDVRDETRIQRQRQQLH